VKSWAAIIALLYLKWRTSETVACIEKRDLIEVPFSVILMTDINLIKSANY